MSEILVTDTLFIDSENEQVMTRAGHRVVRLEKLRATEDELIASLQGKAGYILGGIEQVTDRVLDASPSLRAIAFTGSGYREFIPAWPKALQKGVRLSAAPGANAQSVAEFAVALALPMLRNVFALSATGGSTFFMGREFSSQTALIVGFGRVGQISARILKSLGFRVIIAAHPSVSSSASFPVVEIDEALPQADLVSLHVSHPSGDHVLSEERLGQMRDGTVVVNTAFPDAVETTAAAEQARSGRIRFAFDARPERLPSDLPHGAFMSMNAQSGFLTKEAIKRTSDRVTNTMLNLLSGRPDPDEIRVASRP